MNKASEEKTKGLVAKKPGQAYRILNASYNQFSILTYDHLLIRAKNVLGIIEDESECGFSDDLPF